ncbi:MAG: beta-lactamase family protein, partial [Anaerolineales bacterium]|nr:beta-lactamase family protein [Anaerolineales bacterium]
RLWIIGIIVIALIGIAVIGFNYTRSYTSQFTGPVSTDDPLPNVLISDLEKYVEQLMKQMDVSGLSMVLVEGDQVIYEGAFGVRDLETKAPVDTQTLFGIASTTKSMTAVMIASLVDEGVIAWDTPLIDVLPSFALSNPEVTQKMTFRHTLCMCSSVPEHKEASTVQYSEMTAEDVIEMMATVPLSGTFEHTFNYSTPMVAVGGYLAALADGGEYGNLMQAYADEMQERLFDPTGMTSSTFSIEEVVASGDYATPYYSSLAGVHALPPELDGGIFMPMAPGGALWSTADDLGKYLIMLLNDGVAENGKRVVSAENLSYLWQPQIAMNSQISYGLGWYVEDYHGLTVIHHEGGSAGCASELVVIPELNIGFALLTNQMDQVKPIGRMATYRLLEMLTGSQQVYDQQIRESARDIDQQLLTLSLVTRKTVDPDKIAPFLGSYHNDELGDVKLVLHEDKTLWIDFGEYESPIRPLITEESQFIFFESVFIGKTLQLKINTDGSPSMRWPGNEGIYDFVATSIQEQTK